MFGIMDTTLRDRLLREKDITLERTLEICRASEVSIAQQKEVSKMNDGNVHAVVRDGQQWQSRSNVTEAEQQRIPATPIQLVGRIKDCRFCALEHEKRKEACPAWGKTCSKCRKRNHFAAKCSNSRQTVSRSKARIFNKLANMSMEDDSDSELQIYSVKSVSSVQLRDEQMVTLKLRPKCYLSFQIDNGADCNVLPVHVYVAATGDHEMKNVTLSNCTLFGYGRVSERSEGQVLIRVAPDNCECNLKCELVSGKEFHSVFGYKAFVFLGLGLGQKLGQICVILMAAIF